MGEKINRVRPRGTDAAKIISVIVTEAIEGSGTVDDPVIIQRRFWGLDGTLLAETQANENNDFNYSRGKQEDVES